MHWLNVATFIQPFKFFSLLVRFLIICMTYFGFPCMHNYSYISHNVYHLFVPHVFTNYGKRSFFWWSWETELWNTLKSSVTEVATLLSFRSYYRNFFWILAIFLWVCFVQVFLLCCNFIVDYLHIKIHISLIVPEMLWNLLLNFFTHFL